ncbi:MAG: LacI family transcriptional regulator [Chloroflexi bacterium]|nr:LacI family transcriptional regulator [Chloroflexota bacterium]
MITIRDVAKRAGVSITAASYALNQTGTLSDETRQRILLAAEELNYHPNAFARNLKRKKSLTIGVFISEFAGLFYEDILDGIHKVLLETEYELIVCPESRSVRKVLAHRQVDGAIVFDNKVKTETIEKLASESFPIVVLNCYIDSPFILPLLIDNASGSRQVFRHFYEQGLKNLAFVAGAPDAFDNIERERTFQEQSARHGLQLRCFEGNFTELSGYQAATEIIRSGNLPEAVFCANDQMALGFLRVMQEAGLRAPDDMALAGFDDIIISRYMRPSLTSVRASRVQWGASAATQLINFLVHAKPFEAARLPVELIVRESSVKKSIPSPQDAIHENGHITK